MLKSFIHFWLLLGSPLLLFPQLSVPSDSLTAIWEDSSLQDTVRLEAMKRLIEISPDPEAGLQYAIGSFSLAKAGPYPFYLAHNLLDQALCYRAKSDYPTAHERFDEAEKWAESDELTSLQGMLLFERSLLLLDEGKEDSALALVDRGEALLGGIQNYSLLALMMDKVAMHYFNKAEFETFIKLTHRRLNAARSGLDSRHHQKSLLSLGRGFDNLQMDDSSLFYYNATADMAEARGDIAGMADIQVDIGNIALFDGEYDKALSAFQKGLSKCLTHDIEGPMGWLLRSIGVVYFAQKQYEQALEYTLQAKERAEADEDNALLINAIGLIGEIYYRQENFEEAQQYFQQGYDAAVKEGNQIYIPRYTIKLARIYAQQGKYDLAIPRFKTALANQRRIKNRDGIANTLLQLGKVYQEQKAYSLAIRAYEEALVLADTLHSTNLGQILSARLKECYTLTGQYQAALNATEKWIVYRDSLEKRTNQEATLRFEFENKALVDSLDFVQQQSVIKADYQAQINQRNYLLIGLACLTFMGILLLSYRQKIRAQNRMLELRRERQRKEQLAELNQLKSRFFANISHELRTPLALILGPLSYIMDSSDAWDKMEVQRQLRVMQQNGKNLMQLVNEILDLSKLEANKVELKSVDTPVRDFVKFVIAPYQPQYARNQVSLQTDIVISDDLSLWMDRKKCKKILDNLLSNALKFTPAGGTVSVAVSEDSEHIQFKVSDTGRGIDPEDVEHVFDRFYQGRHAAENMTSGTGIGLSLAKELAEIMQGDISVESSLDTGTTFTLKLPRILSIKQKAAVILPDTEWAAEAGDGGRGLTTAYTILIVEDNEDMRTFVYDLMAPHYQRVLTATNGQEALDTLARNEGRIDLIISDVMMPGLDGFSMLRELKAHPKWQQIPVIMLTSLSTEPGKLEALTIGVDDYLTKPFSVPELRARVQNLLFNYQQRRNISQTEHTEALADSKKTETNTLQEIDLSTTDKAWLDELQQQVKDSFATGKISVETLAEQNFSSPRQFRRKLKLQTGLTPIQFIKEVQFQTALQMLENGEVISLGEVSALTGFEHQTSFSRSFKQRFGKPPGEYLRDQLAVP